MAIEAQEILALALIFIVHVAGGVMLVLGLLGGDMRPRPRWWRRDDGPGDPPPGPRPTPPTTDRRPLPLPGSGSSDVRLRDHMPLRDAHPRPPRRPSRSPRPARSPQRR